MIEHHIINDCIHIISFSSYLVSILVMTESAPVPAASVIIERDEDPLYFIEKLPLDDVMLYAFEILSVIDPSRQPFLDQSFEKTLSVTFTDMSYLRYIFHNMFFVYNKEKCSSKYDVYLQSIEFCPQFFNEMKGEQHVMGCHGGKKNIVFIRIYNFIERPI